MYKIVVSNLGYSSDLNKIDGYEGSFDKCVKQINRLIRSNAKEIEGYKIKKINYTDEIIDREGTINIIDTEDIDRGIYLRKVWSYASTSR